MHVAFVADPHVWNHRTHGGPAVAGINVRCRQTMDVLQRAVRKADEMNCEALVVLGDLFDGVRPEPQVESETRKILLDSESGHVALLLGNHERVSDLYGDHALGPQEGNGILVYARSGRYWLNSEDELACYVAMVPFREGDPREWLEKAIQREVADYPERCLALCLHLGIRDGTEAKWAQEAADAVDLNWLVDLCRKYGARRVLAGNWHTYREWNIGDVRVTQVGALCPTGWDNPGVAGYGSLIVCGNDASLDERAVIHGPRFIQASTVGILEHWVSIADPRDILYVRASVHPDKLVSTREAMLELAKHHRQIAVVEVLPDQKVVSSAAQRAAQAARASSTLADSVRAYFSEAKFPGADPAKVESRVMRYLDLDAAEGG